MRKCRGNAAFSRTFQSPIVLMFLRILFKGVIFFKLKFGFSLNAGSFDNEIKSESSCISKEKNILLLWFGLLASYPLLFIFLHLTRTELNRTLPSNSQVWSLVLWKLWNMLKNIYMKSLIISKTETKRSLIMN